MLAKSRTPRIAIVYCTIRPHPTPPSGLLVFLLFCFMFFLITSHHANPFLLSISLTFSPLQSVVVVSMQCTCLSSFFPISSAQHVTTPPPLLFPPFLTPRCVHTKWRTRFLSISLSFSGFSSGRIPIFYTYTSCHLSKSLRLHTKPTAGCRLIRLVEYPLVYSVPISL